MGKIALELDRNYLQLLIQKQQSDLALIKAIKSSVDRLERDALTILNWLIDLDNDSFFADEVEE